MKLRFIYFVSVLMVFSFIAGCGKNEETAKILDADKQSLIRDLKGAFTVKMTAAVKFDAYSKKAKEEGFENIAKLFEAASKSESVHAKNHREALEKLGGMASEVKPEFTVRSTKENLDDAIKGKIYELSTMYPEIKRISDAIGEFGKDASKSFDYAIRTETKFKIFYEEALKAIDAKTVDKLASVFWICPVCGNTVAAENELSKCSVCNNDKLPWIKL